jgi:hypothetical protein
MQLVYLLRWLGFMDDKREVVHPKLWDFVLYSSVALFVLILLTLSGVLDPTLK